jgi:hypothetical protein
VGHSIPDADGSVAVAGGSVLAFGSFSTIGENVSLTTNNNDSNRY